MEGWRDGGWGRVEDEPIQNPCFNNEPKAGGTVQCSAVQCSAVQCIALQCIAVELECSGGAVSPPPALYIIGSRAAFNQNLTENIFKPSIE